MTQITLGDQVIMHDRNATELLYRQIGHGDADECGCLYCTNFAAQRATAFPDSFRSLLERLGIDPSKEGEVFEYGPTSTGKYQYGGWFYLTGEIVSTGEVNANSPHTADFRCWFTSSFPDAPAFQGGPLIAVEFITSVDWHFPIPSES